jgi:hypothetical protein
VIDKGTAVLTIAIVMEETMWAAQRAARIKMVPIGTIKLVIVMGGINANID